MDFFAVKQETLAPLMARIDQRVIKLMRIQIEGVPYYSMVMNHYEAFCTMLNMDKTSYEMVPSTYEGVSILKSKKKPASKGEAAYVAPPPPPEDPAVKLRRQYIELCQGRGGSQLIKLRTQVTEQEQKIALTQHELVTAFRNLDAATEALTLAEQKANTMSVFFEQEFDKMVEHPDIEKVEVADNLLLIYTAPVTLEDRGVTYDIGKFKVTLFADGRNGCVRMRNLTRKVEGSYDHPHVLNENPCLGNIKEALPELIAQWQFPAAVALCIQFLKSYTSGDGGNPHRAITFWPVAK